MRFQDGAWRFLARVRCWDERLLPSRRALEKNRGGLDLDLLTIWTTTEEENPSTLSIQQQVDVAFSRPPPERFHRLLNSLQRSPQRSLQLFIGDSVSGRSLALDGFKQMLWAAAVQPAVAGQCLGAEKMYFIPLKIEFIY